MNTLEHDVRERLKNVPVITLNSVGRYRLVNPHGQVYSQFTGWTQPDGKLFGHQFHKSEALAVQQVLQLNGQNDARIEKDPFGTTFTGLVTLLGVFAKPDTVKSMAFFLVIFILALLITQETQAPERFLELLQNEPINP